MGKDKRKEIDWDLDRLKSIVGRKDPKGKAKTTKVHRDKSKYTRKEKHRG